MSYPHTPVDPTTGSTWAHLTYDVVVIGAGVAGLAFSLQLPPEWRVALLTKGHLGESNTRYAQGGISAAIGPEDSVSLHGIDTVEAGAKLNREDAVRTLVDAGPEAVRWLLEIGTKFDRELKSGELALGREAAHSRHRVLHAGGDATGAEVERALVAAVHERPSIDVFQHAFAIDLITESGSCTGLLCDLGSGSPLTAIHAPSVVVAAGGAGQLWAVTSNPAGATADGLAMAIRAGAVVADTEFVQFHPTVLAAPGKDPFLISEAVRGEGAWLVDHMNQRFMMDVHPLAELAPRDVVARGIQEAIAASDRGHVYLDLSHLDANLVAHRFPTISAELKRQGLGLAFDPIPVAPAAHYFIGGIAASSEGMTSMPGLFALGEASCTGVHGANRLASNSLLEGLVFGTDCAELVASTQPRAASTDSNTEAHAPLSIPALRSGREPEETDQLVQQLRRTMSQHVAVVRNATGMELAQRDIQEIAARLNEIAPSTRRGWEARNMAIAAQAVVGAAIHREESRGAHYRSDFAETIPDLDHVHSLFEGPGVDAWRYGSLDSVVMREVASIS